MNDESGGRSYTPINVRALAVKVSPKIAKIIPGFIYRKLERVLHIEDLNEFFEKHSDDNPQDFLDAVVERLDLKLEFDGDEEAVKALAGGKSVMFVSNHPYGGPEAMLLFDWIHRYFPSSRLVAQSFLKFIKPLGSTCVYNKKDVRTLYEAVQNDSSLLFYPAGYCSRRLSTGDVFDYDWKSSFVKIAKKNNMPVVVFYTDGILSRRMHRWTKFRQIFHIKTSIETIFLVDEMFRLSGKTIRIVIGDTIDPARLGDDVDDREWAARIRQYCFDLRKNPHLSFSYEKKATLPSK